MERVRKLLESSSSTYTTHAAEPEEPELSMDEKKELFIAALKASYKKQYDAIQPIPYIKDRLYCVNKVFVEGSIEGLTERRNREGSWERLDSYNHIYTDPRIQSMRRIIEGEPGYGKSTLTLQLAYDWCNDVENSPFFGTDILILLRLRQLGYVKTIERAIKLFLLPEETRVGSPDIRHFLANSSSVKILLDGYDEYPDRDSGKRSDVELMIRFKEFRNFDVTLTTRYLPKNYAVSETNRVKLKGFDEIARDQYIRKAVVGSNDEKAVNKIKQGLKDNPILDDLCQVPLFFVTFAHMTHEREDFKKFKSVTEFFIFMMKCFHSHTKRKTKDHNVKPYDTDLEAEHTKLDKVAFHGLNRDNQQIVWDKQWMLKRLGQAFYDHYIRVGILVEEEVYDISVGPNGEEIMHKRIQVRFYHKIFCEWFASFEVMAIAAIVSHSDDLGDLIGKMDPFDLQYVYRFACGLNRRAASNIIEYLKTREDCDKFAILCILEQKGDTSEIINTVSELCSKKVFISDDDSKLLQRSTVQLLQIASSHDIPISHVNLRWSFSTIDNNTITLLSGIVLQRLSSLESMAVNSGPEKPELTEDEVAGLINYVTESKRFKTLRFYNCHLPDSIKPVLISEEAKSRNIGVLWASNASRFDFRSGQWKKADDIKTITELCSRDVAISNKDNVSVQRSAIELLVKASNLDIPIDSVRLGWSFKEVDETDNIILHSGFSLPILTSVENVIVQTEGGREMKEQEVIGIINNAQHSKRLKQIQFAGCLLPPPTHLGPFLSVLQSRHIKVLWLPYGVHECHYKLHVRKECWALSFGTSTALPMKKLGEVLTDRDYNEEKKFFRRRYRNKPWQQSRVVAK